ncbi:MAG: hypothetical protein NT124_01015 [Candidatus Dependentiae bacterium]|nr:hypothetical protein [Candidatus Dependentiae bacterium]
MIKRSRIASMALSSLLFIGLANPQPVRANRFAAAGAFLASSCLLSYYKDAAAAHPSVQKIATKTNTDSEDLIDAATLSLYYWAWSFFYSHSLNIGQFPEHNDMNDGITELNRVTQILAYNTRYNATVRPLIQMAATSKTWTNLFKKLPLLNKLACSDPDCMGVCDTCEYKHLIRKAPLELIPVAAKKIYDDNRRNQAIHEHNNGLNPFINGNGDCPVCLDENVPVIPICTYSQAEGHKVCATCLAPTVAAGNGCPTCRRPILPAILAAARAVPPHLPDAIPFISILKEKLKSLGISEPLWTLFRRNKLFLYRWPMAIWKINPLYSRHITCKNYSCNSICHQCKLKKAF